MRKPNFFVIGAPKCGTTSLAAWLAEHPKIFLSKPKELNYFNTDFRKRFEYSFFRYENYFVDANDTHIAIGEATTSYFCSKVAVKNIFSTYPNARFVVCLRSPVEMAVSLHGQMLSEAKEVEPDFETAWQLQPKRKKGLDVPRLCTDAKSLLYYDLCSLGTHLDRVLSQVPRERVYVIILDDLRRSPATVYQELLSFLGVPDDGRQTFPVLNQARRVPRWVSILTRLVSDIKRRTGIKVELGFLVALRQHLGRKGSSPISVDMHRQLVDCFRPEVEKLEQIIGRDLSHWLADKSQSARTRR